MNTDESVILQARDIVKTYGGTRALKGVNFDIRRGTVTTLFGENGAGKSTLMKILSGVEQPTSGRIVLDGEDVSFATTNDARDHGIAIIHQELSLAPNLSVRDNIFLGREITRAGAVDYAEEARQTRALLQEMRLDVDPSTPVGDLRVGQQQIVEIARALSIDARILIMDEPTSALAAREVEVLFGIIDELTARGVSLVYISHHLEEALRVTDHAVVLRDGTMTARGDRDEIDLAWIVRHMVGENFDLGSPPEGHEFGAPVLEVQDLVVRDPDTPERAVVDGLSLQVRAGEIVCLYGLMGAGRTELLEAVAGRGDVASGRILLDGEELGPESIRERIARGVGLVPEDRQRDGLVQTMSVGQNLTLASIRRFLRRGLLSRPREKALATSLIQDVTVKAPGPEAPIGSLSGGNQQKVVIGKVMATDPAVMLLDEPSRGIDIGAKAEVFGLLAEHARQGLAVLFTTSEIDECFSIAHRIVVLRRGRVSAEFGPDAARADVMAASGEVLTS
ncbi:sugar ABC transporter ATP-binding protein [Brachybacterium saurashtrense]|uniref:Sugar ABC transporter ATP-binding protein n=1 Tax=Brachybacterium saurashtrense TaxID=556288 RepID=A0A345YR21_9MICO|nr:sugar ABC transporter ATP-binding protein [Brachybacterium saurashtrense]AXK46373.1 sugar ABC transporter ATP-binding protein [Brachybacterium saurashtrense]RRR24113.1 sugar ABC transporter ATP-binding protein [Brachybacterium saurashtrense]